MDKQLFFYEVKADYITYLLGFDSKVPRVDYSDTSKHDKFLCGIVLFVNGHNYFAPISSFTTPQRTNLIIKNEDGNAISSIRFSFMIPVPLEVVAVKQFNDEPSVDYRRLLELELRFCRRNSKTIHRQARFIYNMVIGNKDSLMVKNCCDFRALEAACVEYAKFLESKTPDGEKPSDVCCGV